MSLVNDFWLHSQRVPMALAIERLGDRQVGYAELAAVVASVASELGQLCSAAGSTPRVGLVASNSVEWIVADLSLQLLGYTEIPVPLGFSHEQAYSMLRHADLIVVDEAGARMLASWQALGLSLHCAVHQVASLGTRPISPVAVREVWTRCLASLEGKEFIAKVIHTSGTTSQPKGVRIRLSALDLQTRALGTLVGDKAAARYLSIVPLSLLIEQLCAVHVPLSNGGAVILLPAGVAPFTGGATRAADYLQYIAAAKPTLLMVPPAMVDAIARRRRELVAAGTSDAECMARIFGAAEPPLLTCGGAPVTRELLDELFDAGIPVYEGYGLSENTAVACWNCQSQFRRGTVGRPLPHIEARLSDAGELLLRGPTTFAGYEGTDPTSILVDDDGWLHTGDLATIEDGFVTLRGRKKTLIINSASRNLSPEWVEGVYREHDTIKDIVVFGDRLEQLVALIVPETCAVSAGALRTALDDTARSRLPDYASISHFVMLAPDDPMVAQLFTVTGRPRRDAIWPLLVNRIESLSLA